MRLDPLTLPTGESNLTLPPQDRERTPASRVRLGRGVAPSSAAPSPAPSSALPPVAPTTSLPPSSPRSAIQRVLTAAAPQGPAAPAACVIIAGSPIPAPAPTHTPASSSSPGSHLAATAAAHALLVAVASRSALLLLIILAVAAAALFGELFLLGVLGGNIIGSGGGGGPRRSALRDKFFGTTHNGSRTPGRRQPLIPAEGWRRHMQPPDALRRACAWR